MTRTRRSLALIGLTASAVGTAYYVTAPAEPTTTEHRFTLEFPCGKFDLFTWSKILSAPPEAFGNPCFIWTALMGGPPQAM